eukprot:5812181-Pyramimonas_sp.AAC.2
MEKEAYPALWDGWIDVASTVQHVTLSSAVCCWFDSQGILSIVAGRLLRRTKRCGENRLRRKQCEEEWCVFAFRVQVATCCGWCSLRSGDKSARRSV